MFDKILNWKLLKGSHKFPGPDGGTCINEAAIVAAGFEYREVNMVEDCPPCFSRPIAAYAIRLNDDMPDEIRSKLLMPFVLRMAGTADEGKAEAQRYEFMFLQTFKKIVLPALEHDRKIFYPVEKYESVRTTHDVMDALQEIYKLSCIKMMRPDHLMENVFSALSDGFRSRSYGGRACAALAAIPNMVSGMSDWRRDYNPFIAATKILDGAIKMGRNSDIDLLVAGARMEKVKNAPRQLRKKTEFELKPYDYLDLVKV